MKKLRIGVLMGGRSQEKEVSLNSGRTVCDHLDTSKYLIIPIFEKETGELYLMPRHFLHRGKISDFEHRLDKEAEKLNWDSLKNKIDFLYIAQHGRFSEDGRLQGFLEILKIPYFGSKVFASALGMDKIMQRAFLKAASIKVPNSIVIYPERMKDFEYKDILFPCIVKPAHEGSSLGVNVVYNVHELKLAVEKAATITPGIIQPVLIEEYITGMEFSCIVLTDYKKQTLVPLPPTEISKIEQSKFFDYEQKYMPGRALKFTPARCTEKQKIMIQEACIGTMKALGFANIGRIDGFLTDDDQVFIIDPNSFCGMDPASFAFLQAAEINMSNTQLINHIIETELYNYGMLEENPNEFFNENKTEEDKKLKVAVLLGGRSNEKEISLASGRNICYKLSPKKYTVIPIFVNKDFDLYKIDQRLLVRNKTTEIEAELDPKTKILWSDLPNCVDFVFIGLHGGEGENGCVQGALETLGLPYNGSSVLASALCMDKFKTNQFLKQRGINIPDNILVAKNDWDPKNLEKLVSTYPKIVKPHDDGCSNFVQKANNFEELCACVETVFASGKKHALIEEYVKGIELTVGVIGNSTPRALPPSMSIANAGILSIEEKFLPGAGENQTPAPISKEAILLVQKTAEEAYFSIGCKGYARIDCFYQPKDMSKTGNDEVVVLEINTLPGMTPATCIFHQAAEIGLQPMDFIDLIIQLGLEQTSSKFKEQDKDQNILNVLEKDFLEKNISEKKSKKSHEKNKNENKESEDVNQTKSLDLQKPLFE